MLVARDPGDYRIQFSDGRSRTVRVEEGPAPQRLAPHAVALTAEFIEDDEELEYEADAEDGDEEIDDIEAFEDDEPEAFAAEAEDEDKTPAPDDEPVRIRQRYARR